MKHMATVLLISAGAALTARTGTASAVAPVQHAALSMSVITFPQNASGQTYGSAAGVSPSQEPALIEAVGTDSSGNQVTGYVLRSQLDAATGASVHSPLQAVGWMYTAHADSIPLVARDGKTVVGQFAIVQSTAVPNTFSQACGTKGYYGPTDGYSYNNYSCIVFSTGSAGSYGVVTAEADNYVNVPTGYLGALPRVFKSNGALCIQGSWYYNSGQANSISLAAYRPAAVCGSGYYYSSGLTRAYNGNGYNTFSSFRSPNLHL